MQSELGGLLLTDSNLLTLQRHNVWFIVPIAVIVYACFEVYCCADEYANAL